MFRHGDQQHEPQKDFPHQQKNTIASKTSSWVWNIASKSYTSLVLNAKIPAWMRRLLAIVEGIIFLKAQLILFEVFFLGGFEQWIKCTLQIVRQDQAFPPPMIFSEHKFSLPFTRSLVEGIPKPPPPMDRKAHQRH